MGGAGKFGSVKGGYHFSFMCNAPFTLRNYAGRQIERCAHQSRDERNLLERILIFILNTYDVGRGYCAFLTHLLQKKRLSLSEIGVYVSLALTVEAFLDVWALGDCAVIPTNRADYYPPTAQRASREGKVMAYNIVASVRSEALKPFQRKALDQLASIGRRQNSRHQLLRVYRVVALTNDLFAKITTASESPLDSLKKNRMDTLQFLIVSDDSRSCKDL
jgi:hypothetical protein